MQHLPVGLRSGRFFGDDVSSRRCLRGLTTAKFAALASQNWRNRGFLVACAEAGLVEETEEDGETVVRPKYRPYDLRHFYASMFIEQRVSLKRAQYLMGHEDVSTTLNVYGHLIERAEVKPDQSRGLIASMGNTKYR
jgi:integrase